MKKLSFLTRSNKGGFLLALIVTIYSINLLLIITYVDFLDNEFNSPSSSSTSSFSLLNILPKTTTSVSGNGNGGDDAGPAGSYSHFCPRRKSQNENVEKFNNNNNNNIKSKKPRYHPIILWGIPTYDDREEAQRRNAIRESYLSYYDSATTPNRICSLSNYTCFDDEETRSQCQIVYTFFMGANPNGPTERLTTMNDIDDDDDFRTLTISSPPSEYGIDRYHGEEAAEDITYLNIQENQFDGKMTTWFYFGSLVAKEFPSIEYIAKVDSDTLVFIPNFLDYMEQNLPPPLDNNKQQQRVYVGRANDRYACDINLKNHDHPCPLPLVGDVYMTGDLNMMTTNLAEYITSSECPRKNITISSHEDISISNYVYSHKEKITSVVVPNHKLLVTATHDMDYNSVNLKQQFGTTNITYYLWAHSKRQTNFDYFKHIWNYNRIWKKFERKLKHQQEYSSTYIPKKVV